jgi:hypothetical protein
MSFLFANQENSDWTGDPGVIAIGNTSTAKSLKNCNELGLARRPTIRQCCYAI